ncbi:hypothetical protein [Wolbachia endosymbiont of Tetranychus urticae]|uniref:hypothetical protein n=1 Tax=Wolbachia endosymbiont of Tetranychus urticae TaxID=169184 RepID=UPI00397B0995
MIEQGANPNATDHLGRYLLHLQIAKSNFKGAKALIENGADVNLINQEVKSYRRLIMGVIVFPKVNDKGIIKYLSYNGI